MSGTDKSKTGVDLAGPAVILVEPQLGENIGMAARAMGNFALTRLRIVKPRDGWPNVAAQRAAAGADHILERAELAESRRDGRSIIYTAGYGRMRDLLGFLVDDCCVGHPEICTPGAATARSCIPG